MFKIWCHLGDHITLGKANLERSHRGRPTQWALLQLHSLQVSWVGLRRGLPLGYPPGSAVKAEPRSPSGSHPRDMDPALLVFSFSQGVCDLWLRIFLLCVWSWLVGDATRASLRIIRKGNISCALVLLLSLCLSLSLSLSYPCFSPIKGGDPIPGSTSWSEGTGQGREQTPWRTWMSRLPVGNLIPPGPYETLCGSYFSTVSLKGEEVEAFMHQFLGWTCFWAALCIDWTASALPERAAWGFLLQELSACHLRVSQGLWAGQWQLQHRA